MFGLTLQGKNMFVRLGKETGGECVYIYKAPEACEDLDVPTPTSIAGS